jgi:hypothetical protein
MCWCVNQLIEFSSVKKLLTSLLLALTPHSEVKCSRGGWQWSVWEGKTSRWHEIIQQGWIILSANAHNSLTSVDCGRPLYHLNIEWWNIRDNSSPVDPVWIHELVLVLILNIFCFILIDAEWSGSDIAEVSNLSVGLGTNDNKTVFKRNRTFSGFFRTWKIPKMPDVAFGSRIRKYRNLNVHARLFCQREFQSFFQLVAKFCYAATIFNFLIELLGQFPRSDGQTNTNPIHFWSPDLTKWGWKETLPAEIWERNVM